MSYTRKELPEAIGPCGEPTTPTKFLSSKKMACEARRFPNASMTSNNQWILSSTANKSQGYLLIGDATVLLPTAKKGSSQITS